MHRFGQTRSRLLKDNGAVIYLAFAASAAVLLLLVAWTRERRWVRRERSIRRLLDGADALELQLQQCREHMRNLKEMLIVLPEEMSAEANSALTADAKVDNALRDVLAHRLWIKQHAVSASQQELDAACSAMRQSSDTLARQLERLAQAAADLERAQSSARSIARRT